jgi:micrococcal nuclease
VRHIFLLHCILILLLAETTSSQGTGKYFPVTKIVDGDTFWINDGSEKGLKIRLIGIDAPESSNSRNKEIGQFGYEAK